MSLLPDQITANNFKDFYDKIKPYLNYQPTMGFTPVGTVISIMGTHAPAHYLVCDGTVYNIAEHAELANYFNEQFGSYDYFGGDGVTTFAVPDLRGEFLRGSGTATRDSGSGGAVGEHQDATRVHKMDHTMGSYVTLYGESANTLRYDKKYGATSKKTTSVSASQGVTSTAEYPLVSVRPTNTSVLYCIAEKNIFIQVLGGGGGTGDMSTADYAKLGITDTVDQAVSLYDGTNTLTATILELNKLHGTTATTSELNKVHGLTPTTTELNYVDGVTSPIQTQIDGKSVVSWTQSVTTGTKIATVNINGTPIDVYVPTVTPGTTNYNELSNRPQINGTTLTGNKTSAQLGIANQMISDEGTVLASQPKVNFTDFDLSNNTSANQTEIKAHELTAAEVTEILADLPNGAVNMMPVLFDESGAEKVVGWYKLANGTKKPVYEKSFITKTSDSSVKTNITHGITNLEAILSGNLILKMSNSVGMFSYTNADSITSYTTISNYSVYLDSYDTTNIVVFNGSNRQNKDILVTVRYTKTTDTPI